MVAHTWEKGKQYLKKMGGIILVASIIVWALGYFPLPDDPNMDNQARQEQSYIGRIGKAVEPVFRPQGFNWKLDVGLLSGMGAKRLLHQQWAYSILMMVASLTTVVIVVRQANTQSYII